MSGRLHCPSTSAIVLSNADRRTGFTRSLLTPAFRQRGLVAVRDRRSRSPAEWIPPRALADLGGQCQTIHHRHVQVRYGEVERYV